MSNVVRLPTADAALLLTLEASIAKARAERWARTVANLREVTAKAADVHYEVVRARGLGKLREDPTALAISAGLYITALELLVEALDKQAGR